VEVIQDRHSRLLLLLTKSATCMHPKEFGKMTQIMFLLYRPVYNSKKLRSVTRK